MSKQSFVPAVLLACALHPAAAETLQLKDQASLTGKILAEKSDQIVLDLGYTVLVTPPVPDREHLAD